MQVTRVRGLASPILGEILLWVVALAPVLAVLTVPILVLEDGGLHLTSASSLEYLLTGRFSDVLAWRPGVPPNLTVEIVLLGLLQVLPPIWALKVVVAAVLVGFALAARRLVVAGGATAAWATVLLPFAWHRPLAMGFLGFSAAVVLALFTIALVLERPARPPLGVLGALLVVTWLTHLVPALVATAVCGAVVVLAVVDDRQHDVGGGPRRTLVGVALASSPVLVLTAAFVLLNPPGRSAAQSGSVFRRIVSVLGLMKATVSTVRVEYAVYGVVAIVLYVCAGAVLVARWRNDRSVRPVDALLLAAIGGAVVAVVAPEGVGGGGSYLGDARRALPGADAGGLGRSPPGQPGGAIGRPGAAAAAVLGALSLLLVIVRLPAMNLYSALATETVELAPCLPEYSTVLQVNLDDVESPAAQTHPRPARSASSRPCATA